MRDFLLGAYTDEQMQAMPTENVYWSLNRNKYSIVTGIVVQIVLGWLWLIASIVPGFALFNGTAGEVSAYSHLAWWFVIDYTCVCFGLWSLNFSLGYSTTEGVIEKNVGSTIAWVATYRFILCLAAASHIVHVVLSGLEFHNKTSTLARDYQWVLIVLISLLSLSVLLVLFIAYRAHVYLKNLKTAWKIDKIDMKLTLPQADEEQGVSPPAAAATVPAAQASRITTPLLAQLSTNKRIMHKLK